jgi:acetyltransferase EpsM
MKRVSVVLIGGGEHGRVVAEAARTQPDVLDLVGFVDPMPCEPMISRCGVPRLGADEALLDHPALFGVLGIGAVGVSKVRATVVERLAPDLSGWATVVHDRAWVSPTAELGEGTVVLAGAIVNSGARIGRHVIVNTGAIVEHDVVLGDFAQVSPGAVVGGGARVGSGTYIGLGASVRDHVNLGADVLVAMGAVVVSSVADGGAVRGVPAR